MLIPRQGPALTMPSGNGELLAGGIKRFGPLLGVVDLSEGEGVGAGGGGINVPSLSGAGRESGVLLGIGVGIGVGVGVGAGSGGCDTIGVGVGIGVGNGVETVFGMGAYTGSFIGLGSGTFEVTGAEGDKPGVGIIMVEVGGVICVSTDGALRRYAGGSLSVKSFSASNNLPSSSLKCTMTLSLSELGHSFHCMVKA